MFVFLLFKKINALDGCCAVMSRQTATALSPWQRFQSVIQVLQHGLIILSVGGGDRLSPPAVKDSVSQYAY